MKIILLLCVMFAIPAIGLYQGLSNTDILLNNILFVLIYREVLK